jgi:hypothetical protein
MAKKKYPQPEGNGQLSIFDALAAFTSDTEPSLDSDSEPSPDVKNDSYAIWVDVFDPYTDYICESEPLIIFCYEIRELEEINPYLYNQQPFEMLLKGLRALSSKTTAKKISSKSFTVYSGDIAPDFYFYGIGLATGSHEIVQFMQSFLQQVDVASRVLVETSTSDAVSLMPRFRYDKSYVIEYVGEEGAGRVYVDDDDNYKSGLTLYRRTWKPSYLIRKRQSVYGKLVNHSS